jgi:hypothetical protein
MRQTLVFLAVLLSMASIGAAAPACVPGTLTSYLALGSTGCTVGPVTFANFAYIAKAGGGAPKISSDQIQVTPSLQIPATGGFIFSAKWSVTGGQMQESVIRYMVTGPSTGSGNLMLKLGATTLGLFGSAAVREMTTVGNLQVYSICHENCQQQTSAQLPFTPSTPVLQITNDVKVNGQATLSGFTATVDFCPMCV